MLWPQSVWVWISAPPRTSLRCWTDGLTLLPQSLDFYSRCTCYPHFPDEGNEARGKSHNPPVQHWSLYYECLPPSDRDPGVLGTHLLVGAILSWGKTLGFFPRTENSTAHATTSTWTCLPLSSWEPWPCWWRTPFSTTLIPGGPTVTKSGCPSYRRYVPPYRSLPPSRSVLGIVGWGGSTGKGKREIKGCQKPLVREASSD